MTKYNGTIPARARGRLHADPFDRFRPVPLLAVLLAGLL